VQAFLRAFREEARDPVVRALLAVLVLRADLGLRRSRVPRSVARQLGRVVPARVRAGDPRRVRCPAAQRGRCPWERILGQHLGRVALAVLALLQRGGGYRCRIGRAEQWWGERRSACGGNTESHCGRRVALAHAPALEGVHACRGGFLAERPLLVLPHAEFLDGARGHEDDRREGRRVRGPYTHLHGRGAHVVTRAGDLLPVRRARGAGRRAAAVEGADGAGEMDETGGAHVGAEDPARVHGTLAVAGELGRGEGGRGAMAADGAPGGRRSRRGGRPGAATPDGRGRGRADGVGAGAGGRERKGRGERRVLGAG
ncbi:uncharacterized protein B0H18DRAFT_1052666, partial [Fomitopsis serialis]|uniref:uncharacterized protein n=1 Tax=Fomitopsis serialis TaxID=139415 RepID=UPI002007FBEB